MKYVKKWYPTAGRRLLRIYCWFGIYAEVVILEIVVLGIGLYHVLGEELDWMDWLCLIPLLKGIIVIANYAQN